MAPGATRRGGARPRFLLPTLAAGAFGVMALWVAATPAAGHTTTGGHSPTAASRVSPPPVAPAGGQTLADQTVPGSAPPGCDWQLVDAVAVPASAAAGPADVTGGIPAGFAHSPTGALVAAVQIGFRLETEPNFAALTAADVADTPGKAKFLQVASALDVTNPPDPAPGTYLQLAGFQFVSYTPAAAVVQILTARPDGTFQVSTLTVVWADSDWKLVLGATGTESPDQQVVASTVGFIVWGGV